jgi:probable phosphoglycerate mutase
MSPLRRSIVPGARAAGARILYLARHGETAWNQAGRWQGQSDIALNETGRAQAAALAERLLARGIAGVHASDLTRARETAEIIARRLGLPGVSFDVDLRERGFGVFEGLTRDECAARHPDAWTRYLGDRTLTPPGAELQAALVARMRAGVERAAATLVGADDAGLIVSHGGAIRALLAAATGASPPPLNNGATVRVVWAGGDLREWRWLDPP